ncbi:MAG: LLM class flavin-dependent oxidoreductase [Deltaproteobacteria bacterium]|nr:LLM class flavin-dependent oxidoreductase [Deltaproteobacteria bacterium]MBW2394312.1 LLM class flavin-dependent oxidoreductase [Deltaproteobacteria bacterium]
MPNQLPALALAAVPGRRKKTLDLAGEIEKRGFSGIYCASFGDGLGLCEALAFATEHIAIGTSIVNMYSRHASEYAQTGSLIQELSGGRFRFGVGVSHDAMNRRLGVTTGKPLADTRAFVEAFRGTPRAGELPPIVLAALRKKMIALSGEIGDGVVFANVARSHVPDSLMALPDEKRRDPTFFIGDMIPTCISDDREAAAAVNRKTLTMYLNFPNYRNYWKEAGYVEEMQAVEKALEAKERDRLPELMTDRWLADVSLFGSVSEVREGVEAWFDAGVSTPILVPSSAVGNQMKAFEELFAAFA